jgi:RNA polymerase sigma factor (sigma-70 family)
MKSQSSTFHDRIAAHLGPLLNYARAELRVREALGELPPGSIRPADIVDEAILNARERARVAPDRGLYPWLRGLVRESIRRAVEDAREMRRERSIYGELNRPREGNLGPLRLVDVLPDPKAAPPEQAVEKEEFQQALLSILLQLPEEWRESFLLRVRDGLSPAQVAAAEGITQLEASRRIRRAREFLRARLADEYRDVPVEPPSETVFQALERLDPPPVDRAQAPPAGPRTDPVAT